DRTVTGVQTCALPIYSEAAEMFRDTRDDLRFLHEHELAWNHHIILFSQVAIDDAQLAETMSGGQVAQIGQRMRIALRRLQNEVRSEERRVGKECRSRR